MTREEVEFQFTGMAHDHLMASSRVKSVSANTFHLHHLNNQRHNTTNTTNTTQSQQQQHPLQPVIGHLNSIQDRVTTNTQDVQRSKQRQTKINSDSTKETDNSGLTTMPNTGLPNESSHQASALSTIAILRRHPMYDSLVLVKKYRSCLNGYTLEFPTSNVDDTDTVKADERHQHHLNGDTVNGNVDKDDMQSGRSINKMVNSQLMDNIKEDMGENGDCARREYGLGCKRTKLVSVYLDGDDPIYQCQAINGGKADVAGVGAKNFIPSEGGDIVYVPINGLLDRLDNFDRHGISIDSRVYAFAMGLKTAERFLTSSTEKEIQEAPPL